MEIEVTITMMPLSQCLLIWVLAIHDIRIAIFRRRIIGLAVIGVVFAGAMPLSSCSMTLKVSMLAQLRLSLHVLMFPCWVQVRQAVRPPLRPLMGLSDTFGWEPQVRLGLLDGMPFELTGSLGVNWRLLGGLGKCDLSPALTCGLSVLIRTCSLRLTDWCASWLELSICNCHSTVRDSCCNWGCARLLYNYSSIINNRDLRVESYVST